MKQFIFKNKNTIMVLSGILIVSGFVSELVFHNHEIAQLLLIIASIIGVSPIALQAWGALTVKVVSIDVLVTIAVIGAFLISNYEESAIVTFLFLLGAYLEARTLNKTRNAIKELVDMAPSTALMVGDDGELIEVDVDDVDIGDILMVKTGAKVPVDGTVIKGQGSLNEASITGESLPVFKTEGMKVFASTILDNGTIQIVADRVGEDTTFGKIIELVEEAQDSKSEAQRFIDKFSIYYTPFVLLVSIVVWLFTRNVELAVTILVLGCPGALVIGVPISNVAGIGNGAKHGILLKGSEVITDFSKVDTIIFDKTGTLTIGEPTVVKTVTYTENIDRALQYLVSVEKESDHPLAQAILNQYRDIDTVTPHHTEVLKGGGILAKLDEHKVTIGNEKLITSQGIEINDEVKKELSELTSKGNSLVLMAIDNQLELVLGIADQLRPEAVEVLNQLDELGVKNRIMLSGDNQETVSIVASQLNLTEAKGNMLPQDKSAYVKEMIEKGHTVAFVGDGINDSPSLALAHIGIAMGSGTDVAIETSDVVLMKSDLTRLPHALGLTKSIYRNMIQNIVIAVGVVLILLASVLFSDWMNMSIGMFVHEASILVVIANGMRLLRYKLQEEKEIIYEKSNVTT